VNEPAVNGTIGHLLNGAVKSLEVAKPFCFQFIVNNNTKQRTEERTDFVCPWCTLNCLRMYSLMKHLKMSHARLLFQYVDEGAKGRIDVYVNELYDGSYSGAPHDVLLGSQRGPTRRNVVTNIMVFRPRKPTFNMNEFQEADDGELDQQRQYISGHNRIYYHSETCIPILPKELDYDSEGEPDPKWLQRTTKQMIDEFTDVNGGEKELMKLWNLHVMKHG
jgi:polycomb protein SUZ12